MTISSTKDQPTEKRLKDGRKLTLIWDPEGKLTNKRRILSDGTTAEDIAYAYTTTKVSYRR